MTKLVHPLLMAACLLVAAFGCDNRAPKTAHDNRLKKVHYDAATGRYFYVVREKHHGNDDGWFYYWLMNSRNSASDYYTTPAFSKLAPDTLSPRSWRPGDPPSAYASRPPTTAELNGSADQTEVVDVQQANTQEDLDIPDENSLDSMEGVPEAGEGMSGEGASETASDSGDAGGDSGGDGGGDGGGD
jgi:hypothetical protein